MTKVAGRNPYAAWIVSTLAFAALIVIVIVSVPMWPVVSDAVSHWWSTIAPFQGR